MSHHCHAIGCKTTCKPEFLMCPPCWRQVPKRMQYQVYKYYRPGQCDDMQISREWLIAADTAIAHVAVKNGFMSEEQAAKMIARAEFRT